MTKIRNRPLLVEDGHRVAVTVWNCPVPDEPQKRWLLDSPHLLAFMRRRANVGVLHFQSGWHWLAPKGDE